jgi:DNA-3-methyladenine glycosylase II
VLIFTLGRADVLPVDDLGLRTAVQRAYGLEARPGRAELTALGEPWRPFRSAATLYLWQSLNLPAE